MRAPDESIPYLAAWLDHHLVVSAFGGLMMGMTTAVLTSRSAGGDVGVITFGWLILGAVHGPLLWPLLARRPWWCTAVIFQLGVVAAAAGAIAWGDLRHAFLVPAAALWGAAVACWRLLPPVPLVGCCRVCAYDLRGQTTPRCPECGTPFIYPDERTAYRMPCLSAASRAEGIKPHSLKETPEAP